MYMDRYAEQLWLTLVAKAPEITLFDIRQVLRPLPQSSSVSWRRQQTSFDFDEMIKPIPLADGTTVQPTTIARAAGYTFEKLDKFLGKLGKPVGVKSFKPYHSTGEDFLHNYLGMCGIAMDLVPQIQYPTNDAWDELSAMDESNGWPMLISTGYAKGTLYVLAIPESFTDLYNLPPTILSRIRDTVTRELPVRVDGPGMVSLFLYDNGTLIVGSFLDQPVDVSVTVTGQIAALHDLLSGELLSPAANRDGGPRPPMFGRRGTGPSTTFAMPLKPHSYRAFHYQ